MSLHTRRVYNHTGYDVTDYFRSETTAKKQSQLNAASDGFGLNSSAAAFCLPTNSWASCSVNYRVPPTLPKVRENIMKQYPVKSILEVIYFSNNCFCITTIN